MNILEKAKKFDMWAGAAVLVGAILTIVGFIPMLGLSLGSTKSFFLVLSSTIALLLWLVARSIDGTFVFPKTKIAFLYLGVLVAGVLSTVFSTQSHDSFIGKNFETTTLAVLIALLVASYMAVVVFRNTTYITRLYKIVTAGFVAVALFTLVRIFVGANTLNLNLLSAKTDTLVGSWIDFGLLTGMVVILMLLALEFLPLPKKKKTFVTAVFAFSLIVALVTNVTLVWMFIGGAALLSFVFQTLINKKSSEGEEYRDSQEIHSPLGALVGARNIPFLSLGLCIVSLFFILTANSFGAFVSNKLGVTYAEVRPSPVATFGVGIDGAKDNLVFGAGLNRFSTLWSKYKTEEVIATPYWNVDFTIGSGYIPTQIATGGIVGALAWIVFSLVCVALFVRKIFTPLDVQKTQRELYLYVVSLVLGIFGFLTMFFYIPGACILLLSMLWIALFVGHHYVGSDGLKTVSILKNNKRAFLGLALLLIALLATLYFAFLVVKKQAALMYEAHGTLMAARGDVDGSERAFLRAAKLSPDDSVYQALSQLSFARINTLLSSDGLSPATLQAEFQNKFALAEGFALQAIAYDNGSYRNWVFLGDIYKAFAPLGVAGAYDGALTAYGEAQKIVPTHPLVTLRTADLERANKNIDKARALGRAALEQKSNYLEAIFFLSEIERSVGNKVAAYELESSAGTIDPNNPELFYQLGLVAYNAGETARAITSFERAVLLNPRFSNARFMLAVVYQQGGRRSDALSVLEALYKEIPDNADLGAAIDRVKRGGSVLIGITAPTPVIEEETPEAETPLTETPTTAETL